MELNKALFLMQKQAVVLQATASKERVFLEAEGRERQAAAEAKAIELVAGDMLQGREKAAQYFFSNKYILSMRDMASAKNSKTIFMPFEATKVVSGLGSLIEIAKVVFQQDTEGKMSTKK